MRYFYQNEGPARLLKLGFICKEVVGYAVACLLGSKMYWQPLNLTEVCPAYTQVTACTYFGYIYLNLLVQLFGDSKDRRIQEKLRLQGDTRFENERVDDKFHYGYGYEVKEKREEEYDFIVVGAGAAGCVVANRLTEVPEWKVLLLEAGPEQPDITLAPALSRALIGSTIDWKYYTQPDGKSCLGYPGKQCSWPRGKTMGGSSSINSLVYIRGNRVDYDTWAAMGNEGWSYKDVLPFFKKSEKNLNIEGLDKKYHGVHGPQSVSRFPFIDKPSIMLTEAFHERGLPILDYNGANQLGTMQAQAVSENGERVSTNNAFIQPIRYKRKNLTVKIESEAVKILIDQNKRAYGVKYIRDGKMYTALAKKDVIVSGGAINAPKLLLLSGIGPKKQLEHLHIPVIEDLPVGENLHDHVTFNGISIALPNNTATTISNEEILEQVAKYKAATVKRGPISGNGPVNTVSFIKTEPDLPAPDIQYQVDNTNWRQFIREPATSTRLAIFPRAFYDAVLPRTMNLVPKSRGKLVLNSTDPYGPPVIYANYYGDERDLIPLIKGVRFLLSLENTEAFKSRGAHFVKVSLPGCTNYVWGTDAYTECLARTYTLTPYHPVGTCKMGPKWDKTAVVDPRLRVYGISGLRVIDASIMPVVPRGNTNAPSILVGERGVELVKEDWLHNYLKK